MLSTIIVIIAVWFIGSIPVALLAGKMLGKLNRTPDFAPSTEPMPVMRQARIYEAPALEELELTHN